MTEFDVAIVGAGRAGRSTAITLAQQGNPVALIERVVFPRDKLCGEFLNPINWPVFDRLSVSAELLIRPQTKNSTFRMTAADDAEAIGVLPVYAAHP